MICPSFYVLCVCLCGLQCLRQLIGAGGGLHAALHTLHTADHIVNIHTVHQRGDTFQIAVAAANELNIFDLVILHIKVDHLRAGALGLVLIHI